VNKRKEQAIKQSRPELTEKQQARRKNELRRFGRIFQEFNLSPKQLNLLYAYQKKSCNMSMACKAVGVSIAVEWSWAHDPNSDFGFAKKICRESLIDMVEGQLIKQIRNGHIVAILFFLKCQAKHRGYVEKADIDLSKMREDIKGLIQKMSDAIKEEIKDEGKRRRISERIADSLCKLD